MAEQAERKHELGIIRGELKQPYCDKSYIEHPDVVFKAMI